MTPRACCFCLVVYVASHGSVKRMSTAAYSRSYYLAVPAQFGSPAVRIYPARTGGFASPPHSGFALFVCDNMHNVGFHYKAVTLRRDLVSPEEHKSANYVTFLWPKMTLKSF